MEKLSAKFGCDFIEVRRRSLLEGLVNVKPRLLTPRKLQLLKENQSHFVGVCFVEHIVKLNELHLLN